MAAPRNRALPEDVPSTGRQLQLLSLHAGQVPVAGAGTWPGRLQGLGELSGKRACPGWVAHEPPLGKSKTSAAAEYPEALADKYASLVIKTFKQNLQLEFWRYKPDQGRRGQHAVAQLDPQPGGEDPSAQL